MNRIAIFSFVVCFSWHLAGMQFNIIQTLRLKPAGSSLQLYGQQWKVEENSLFLNNTGKAVLLDTVQVWGKVVQEYRQTIEIRHSKNHPNRYTFTSTHSTKTTNWAILIGSAWLTGAAALLGMMVIS